MKRTQPHFIWFLVWTVCLTSVFSPSFLGAEMAVVYAARSAQNMAIPTVGAPPTNVPSGGMEPVEAEELSVNEMARIPTVDVQSDSGSGSLDEVFVKASDSFAYNLLTDDQKSVYKNMESACNAFMTGGEDLKEFSVEITKPCSKTDLARAYISLQADHPEYYWPGDTYGFSSVNDQCVEMSFRVDSLYANASSRSALEKTIISEVKLLAATAKKESDVYDQVRVIHDEIINKIDYAYDSSHQPVSSRWAHNIDGVFSSRNLAVCEGYAKAFSFMMNYMGIPQIYIVGDAAGGGHAWNAVSFDNKASYSFMDLTWDDGGKGSCDYFYFAMPKADFNRKHKAYTTKDTGMKWQYDLPATAGDEGMDHSYFAHYQAYAAESIATDDAALSFAKTAGASSPNLRMILLFNDTASVHKVQTVLGLGLSYYTASQYSPYKYYTYVDCTDLKVTNPAIAFTLSSDNITIDMDQAGSQTLAIQSVSPAEGCNDLISFTSSNANVARVSPSSVSAKAGESVTVIGVRSGTATITAKSSRGKYTQTCKVTVQSSYASEHLFLDEACTKAPDEESARIYANGGTITTTVGEERVRKNTKQLSLYTDLTAPVFEVEKGSATKTKKGKLLVGVTSVDTMEPKVKNKRFVSEPEALKIAKATISKGNIKVSAVGSGVVKLWVCTVESSDEVIESGSCEITVDSAPTKLELMDSDPSVSGAKKIKKATLALGASLNVYVKATMKDGSLVEGCGFTLAPAQKLSDCVEVTDLGDGGFRITALGLKNGKSTNVKLVAGCDRNGKRANLALTLNNPAQRLNVQETAITPGEGYSLSMPAPTQSAASQKTVAITPVPGDPSCSCTDKPKIYPLKNASGYTLRDGAVVVKEKPSGNDAKIKARIKNNELAITAPKKLPSTAKACFLVVYNTATEGGCLVVDVKLEAS